jgi:AraC-like DNA-binding protein
MLYLERNPRAPLNRFVRMLWYTKAPQAASGRERILPNGCVQVIVNLARNYLLDCGEGLADRTVAPALVVGCRSVCEIVDRSDMADLIGIIFEPGGFAPFAAEPVDRLANQSVPLEDLWGAQARSLRERLHEACTPEQRFQFLEGFLLERFAAFEAKLNSPRHQIIEFAMNRFRLQPSITSVSAVARTTGWSQRRFSQIFREQVGFSPKVWCRIERFQRAVREIHKGADVAWAELALDCGFYDQSHFANEFRVFSGVDATTYSARRTQWKNHISVS